MHNDKRTREWIYIYIYDNQYISLSMIATLFIFATSNEVYNPRMCDLRCPTAVLTKINDYL